VTQYSAPTGSGAATQAEPADPQEERCCAGEHGGEMVSNARRRRWASGYFGRKEPAQTALSQGSAKEAIAILYDRIDQGDSQAAETLVKTLTMLGREHEADQLSRYGLNADGSIASGYDVAQLDHRRSKQSGLTGEVVVRARAADARIGMAAGDYRAGEQISAPSTTTVHADLLRRSRNRLDTTTYQPLPRLLKRASTISARLAATDVSRRRGWSFSFISVSLAYGL
jgi:hypothetical protein